MAKKKMPKGVKLSDPPPGKIRNFISGCYFDCGMNEETTESVVALAKACEENARAITSIAQRMQFAGTVMEVN